MLRLIRDGETTEVPFGPTTFTMRKLAHGKAASLRRKHTEKGRLDEDAFERAIWLYILAGWTNLADADGKPVEYSPDRVEAVVQSLPQVVVDTLMAEARSPEVLHHEAGKTSSPSSGSD